MVRDYQCKISPSYPWKIPRTFHQQFMFRNFFVSGGLEKFGVSSQGMWAKSVMNQVLLGFPICTESVLHWNCRGCGTKIKQATPIPQDANGQEEIPMNL